MKRVWGNLLPVLLAVGLSLAAPALSQANCKSRLSFVSETPLSLDYAKPTVIIVDGYSSGKYLAPRFKAAGYQVVHVHSHGDIAKETYKKSFNRSHYDADLTGVTEVPQALKYLEPFQNIVAVVIGADSGVIFGDELMAALQIRFPQIPSDGIDVARKDKYFQNERLRELGIDAPFQFKTSKIKEALDWIRKNKLLTTGSKTIVIKPLLGAGTEGVYFCRNEDEVRAAMKELVGTKVAAGESNEEVLLQEFLDGREYVVNTTSRNGHHVVTDIWIYTKRLSRDGKRHIYDYDVIIPFEGPVQSALVTYTLRVLDALGVKNGNGHTEVMMVKDRGPVLVEMNNRMMGSGMPLLAEMAIGHSQIDRTILAYTNPAAFLKLPLGYHLKKYATSVTLTSWKEGVKLRPDAAKLIESVKGYVSHSLNYKPGYPVKETIDLTTALGEVFLMTDTEEDLMKGVEELKQLEDSHAFTEPL